MVSSRGLSESGPLRLIVQARGDRELECGCAFPAVGDANDPPQLASVPYFSMNERLPRFTPVYNVVVSDEDPGDACTLAPLKLLAQHGLYGFIRVVVW